MICIIVYVHLLFIYIYIYHFSRNDLLFFWYALIFSLFLSSIPSLSFVSFVLLWSSFFLNLFIPSSIFFLFKNNSPIFYISLFQSYFERLSKPHGNCSDGTQTNFTSEEYTYTTRACVKSCVQQHIFNKCGCVTDIMMNDTICSPRNQTERTYPLHLCGFVLLVKRNKRIHINMKCQMT